MKIGEHDFDVALDDLKDTWEGLGVVDDATHGPLLPTKILRRVASGEMQEVPIMLGLGDPAVRAKARQRTRAWAKELKLKDRQPVGGALLSEDEDIIAGLEKMEFLALVIRNPTAPYEVKYANGNDLLKTFKAPEVLEAVYTEQDFWQRMNDPRYGSLTGEQLWEVIARVAQEKNPLPLASINGVEQAAFIVRTARLAFDSPTAPWRTQQASTSTPGSESSSDSPIANQ